MMTSPALSDQIQSEAPKRISRTAEIQLGADIKTVFPLFGPVREKEWAYGWDPRIVYSDDLFLEEGMIFITKARFPDETDYRWIVSKLDLEKYSIQYTVSTTDRIWFIDVQCKPVGDKTKATIRYTFTALSEHAELLNRRALESMYAEDLKDWEQAINYYLETGKMFIP